MTGLSQKQAEIQRHYAEVALDSTDACSAARGCGKPIERARLRPGETVLDLGCGGGLDVLAAARSVGADGYVYGLDMTPEMLALAERNALEAGVGNVGFLRGFIEQVPLPDESVDVVTSNCVINLSDDKPAALREILRVLKPGGRFVIADILMLDDALPTTVCEKVAPLIGCVNGVLTTRGYRELLSGLGFSEAAVEVYHCFSYDWFVRRAKKRGQEDLLVGVEPIRLNNALGSAFIAGAKPR